MSSWEEVGPSRQLMGILGNGSGAGSGTFVANASKANTCM